MSGDASRFGATPGDGTGDVEEPPGPRRLVVLIVGTILAAVLVSLVRPMGPLGQEPKATEDAKAAVGASAVGVITGELPEAGSAGRIGVPAPDFGWITPGGDLMKLSDLRGRPVVVNFWATWCVPCRQEMPALDRTGAAHPEVTMLALDLQEDGPAVRAFFDGLGLTKLVPLLDRDGAMARRYAVAALPTTFFLDASGTVRHLAIGGPMSEEQIVTGLAKASQP